MLRQQAQKWISAMVSATTSSLVFAAHPLVTDDTNTQDTGNTQIELNTDRLSEDGERLRLAAFTLTYGIKPNVDLFGSLPVRASSPIRQFDASIGAKWRFWEREETSLGLKSELFFPTGNENKGLGNGRESFGLTLLASQGMAPWVFHANAGVIINRYKLEEVRGENHRALWRASAAAGYELTPKVILVADTGIARNPERTASRNPAFALVGVIYSPNKDTDFDIGYKRALNRAEVDRQIGAGLTLRF